MHENAALLQHLGLHKVWASLHKLALAGRTASRAASVQQQQAAASGGEVAALQQRVEHYREKARALKEQCVALEGAAGRWQAQVGGQRGRELYPGGGELGWDSVILYSFAA